MATLPLRLIEIRGCESNLGEYFRAAWPLIEPGKDFLSNWHLDCLAEYLTAVSIRQIRQLLINMPPRTSKSIPCSVMWPTWEWGPHARPETRWIFVSYAQRLAEKLSLDRRLILESRWYHERWGDRLKIASDQNEKNFFQNTRRGHMLATSIGAPALGMGANFIVVDDPHNVEEAESEAQRKAAIRFIDLTLSTRLDDKKRDCIVVVMQRLHLRDVTGHLIDQGGWELLCLPAEVDKRTIVVFPLSKREVVRDPGELLWPEREGPEEIAAMKVKLGTAAYRAQYLQRPVPVEGNLYKTEWWRWYKTTPVGFTRIIQSWDTASKTGRENDYSACLTLGEAPPFWFVLDIWRGRVEFPELKRMAVIKFLAYQPHALLVEDASSGVELIQELRATPAVDDRNNAVSLPIIPVRRNRDKIAYASAASPSVQAGLIALPDPETFPAKAKAVSEFIAECAEFPQSDHDDLENTLSQFLNWLRSAHSVTQTEVLL